MCHLIKPSQLCDDVTDRNLCVSELVFGRLPTFLVDGYSRWNAPAAKADVVMGPGSAWMICAHGAQ